jgi:dTDP-glucose 4,6-dehydratase
MQSILVTEGKGFISANVIPYFIENNKNFHNENLDLLTYKEGVFILKEIHNNPSYTPIIGYICDKKLIEMLFEKNQFSGVTYFAAGSHVDNSLIKSDAFIKASFFKCFKK